MHDLLREMGREIVHSESPKKPRKRSRLWRYQDFQDVLAQNKVTKVEGIMVELSNSEDIYLNVEGCVSMTNLRLLRIAYPKFGKHFVEEKSRWKVVYSTLQNNYKLHLNGDPKFLSHKLRVLTWHGCPLKSLPSNFDPKNLVHLDMCFSHIEQLWVGTKRIKELISIDLSFCEYLKEIPPCTEATKLEKLTLKGCTSLLKVHPSILALEKLVFLNLKGCKKLKILPSSIHQMKSLKFLDLRDCFNLEMFPEILEDMEALLELKLDRTAIEELPSSIERLRRLESLSLKYCESLICLPDSICNLAGLTYLYLNGCSKLHNLPENFGCLESLLELELKFSGIEQLPVSILRLKLGKLSFYGCKRMKAPLSSWRSSSIEGRWNAVVFIDFSDCKLLELSDAIADFSSLKILNLSRTNLESLPSTMNRLVFLEWLELKGCRRLKSIPELSSSISYINADGCTALETVSTPNPPYDSAVSFKFSNCSQLVQNDLFRDIVETHFPPQGNYSRSFYIYFPGSEIPERFIHQFEGSSVTAQLPPNSVDKKFLGFAICAVIGHGAFSGSSKSPARCFCTFKGNHCEYRFSFYLFRRISEIGPIKRNHMFMGYVPWPEFGINGEEVIERRYTEAKFQIRVFNCLFIQRCGVQFFFANNDEVAHQDFGEPMVHSESSLERCWPYHTLTNFFGGANRNFREFDCEIEDNDENDCEIEDNDSSGKRKILSRWTQKIRVTSALMQGHLDDGFDWERDFLTKFKYNCTYEDSCDAKSKLRFSIDDPTTLDITYIGRHTCWKTLPMLTHQARLTPGMGLEGPSDGFNWEKYDQIDMPGDKYPSVYYVCTPQNVRGCMAIKGVQYANEDQTILKITYRGRHTCTQASSISIGGRGDSRVSPTSLGANGDGGNVIRLADKAVDDNNVNMLPDTNSQDMEHFQNVNDMANNDMAVYGVPSEDTSDAVMKQLEKKDPVDFEEALDFNSLKKRKREMMDSDDDQPNESNSISNNNS